MGSVDEIWLTDFGDPFPGEPAFHRPALIVGPREEFGPDMPYVFVVPLTTSQRALSVHVEVEASATSGLDADSYAQCELLRSVSRRRLVHRLGAIDRRTRASIDGVIATLLDL